MVRHAGTAPTAATRSRCPKVIKVGSDFSGLDGAAAALKRMKVPYESLFVSDILRPSQQILRFVHAPKTIFTDILERTAEQEEPVDLYVTTPPCQDFSMAGKQAGTDGPRKTGALIKKSMQYIQSHKPRVVIFENVLAMLHKKFKPVLLGIMTAFQSLGYKAHFKKLDSRDYGLPHDRRRLYIVGIRADVMKHEFTWPVRQQPTPSVNVVLDPWKPTDKAGRLPCLPRPKEACLTAYKECFKGGRDPRTTPVLVDVGASPKFNTYGIDESKTITRTRGGDGGPWISTRGRKTTPGELLKLQGFTEEDVPWQAVGITKRQLGQLVGNAVSVNTIGCVLEEALWSGGLVKQRVTFPRGDSCIG
jgi:site-specific DNA-cytosine methylase